MTHRERVLAALKHQTPDRVPVDFGGSGSTTISIGALQHLRAYLNIPPEPAPRVFSRKRSATAYLDDAIVERFGIDTAPARPGSPDAGAPREIDADTFVDEWGVTWRRAPGENFITVDGPFRTSCRPCAPGS